MSQTLINPMEPYNLPPLPDKQAGREALLALIKQRGILAALQSFHHSLGDVFRLPMAGFSPVVLAGPEAARFMMATQRGSFRWRVEGDPVAKFLRNGLLMQEGESHDTIRRKMVPPMQRNSLEGYIPYMLRHTDRLTAGWESDQVYDLHLEMRRLALMILIGTLFKVEAEKDLDWLVPAIKRALKYISPGLWLIWPALPRSGYAASLQKLDNYLYTMIAERRSAPSTGSDLLSLLVNDPTLDDNLIRDQLITMLIAGHDTSTSLLSWVLYLLGEHPEVAAQVQAEVDETLKGDPPSSEILGRLIYLEQVIKEALRLYPPIHAANRIVAEDLEFQGYAIPAGSRVLFSIYLTHRHPDHWPQPDRFDPARFGPGQATPSPYTYIPFGGGPRNCIGAAYAQVEAKIVLARLLQHYEFSSMGRRVRPYMGASLDPHPGVFLRIRRRR